MTRWSTAEKLKKEKIVPGEVLMGELLCNLKKDVPFVKHFQRCPTGKMGPHQYQISMEVVYKQRKEKLSEYNDVVGTIAYNEIKRILVQKEDLQEFINKYRGQEVYDINYAP